MAVALIFAADLVLGRGNLPVVVAAALDEPAHLATASLVLAAAPCPSQRASAGFVRAALIGSVAFDLDHLPEVLGWSDPSADRPPTHSALPIALLASIAPELPDRWRGALLGLTSGGAIHLFRDLATGGAPIGSPLIRRIIRLPYLLYALTLIGTAARIFGQPYTAPCSAPPCRHRSNGV